jgi:ribosomal protein S18 acetylase RimI-like enzyme
VIAAEADGGECSVPEVREARVEDAPELGSVHVQSWRRAYRGGLMPDAYLDGLSVEARSQMWREALERPSSARSSLLVVEDEGGDLVGFISVGPVDSDINSEAGEVFALNVAPDAWGRGYGRALLEAGVRELAASGFDTAFLWVHPGNDRARRFYERAGWRADGHERRQAVLGVEVPEARYRMALELHA